MTDCYIAHTTKGRVRLKFPGLKGNYEFFNNLEKQLLESKIFLNVRTNPITGSVILEFEEDINLVFSELRNLNLFEIRESFSELPARRVTKAISKRMASLNGMIRKISSNNLDLKSAVLIFLVASAVYQIARGNVSSIPWYAALFYLNTLISRN